MSLNSAFDAHTLRTELMAPQPMRRATALHAVELELEGSAAQRALMQQVQNLIARGIPFYAPEDAHYRHRVSKVVPYWQRLGRDDRADR